MTVQIFNTDIGTVFGVKICGMIIIKKGKVVLADRVELLTCKRIEEVEMGGYKYLSIYVKIKEGERKGSF